MPPHDQQSTARERFAPAADRREADSIAAANRERDAQSADRRAAEAAARDTSAQRDAERAAKSVRERDDAADRKAEKPAPESGKKGEVDAKAQSGDRRDASKTGENTEENTRTNEAQRSDEKRRAAGEESELRAETRQAAGESPMDAAIAELSANLKSVLLSKGSAKGEGEGAAILKDGVGSKSGAESAKAQAGDAQKTAPADGAEAAELKKFAERVAAARADLKQASAGETTDQRAEASTSNNTGGGKEAAKVDAASGGLRVELDSAKWQLNGRVYGERGGQENIESKVAGLMDRYVRKNGGANGKDSGSQNKNESGGDQQRGDSRNFANRLSDLQLAGTGDVRDANQAQSLEQARLQKMDQAELARENRRLFNELVEKARVNVQSNGNSTASIKMNPAALGRMTLNLEVHQNQVHARILVDSDVAKRVLMDEMDHLRAELGRQGITVESLSIRVREAANMSFMQNSDGAEHSALDQQAAGGEESGDDSAPNSEARQNGDEQSLRSSGDEAGRQYDRDAGALAAESPSRRELSAVNISI